MTRQENPQQPDPTATAVKAAEQLSDVAKLSAEVLDKGLVREHRPVFVYDSKLAKEKKGNAARQEKHREKLAGQGLTLSPVPVAIKDEVKAAGGWDAWLAARQASAVAPAPLPAVAPAPPDLSEIQRLAAEVDRLTRELAQQASERLPKQVEVIKEVPRAETSLEREARELGQRVMALAGIKARLARWLLS